MRSRPGATASRTASLGGAPPGAAISAGSASGIAPKSRAARIAIWHSSAGAPPAGSRGSPTSPSCAAAARIAGAGGSARA
jgi:hypothetical protein